MVIDPKNLEKGVKPPDHFGHIGIQSSNKEPLVEFYRNFFDCSTSFENEVATFLTYDKEHHRVVIVQNPAVPSAHEPNNAGIQHIAFTYHRLEDLAVAYLQRKARGFEPMWSINHGPTTSMYYEDPDHNRIEFQVDNFDSIEECSEFMGSKTFIENPVGTEFDPMELIRRLNAGEDHASIKRRIEIGPRPIEMI